MNNYHELADHGNVCLQKSSNTAGYSLRQRFVEASQKGSGNGDDEKVPFYVRRTSQSTDILNRFVQVIGTGNIIMSQPVHCWCTV